jgi:hypothetical protein
MFQDLHKINLSILRLEGQRMAGGNVLLWKSQSMVFLLAKILDGTLIMTTNGQFITKLMV